MTVPSERSFSFFRSIEPISETAKRMFLLNIQAKIMPGLLNRPSIPDIKSPIQLTTERIEKIVIT